MEKFKSRIPKGHYLETVPITYYTEHLQKKSFYMSPPTGLNPFGKTSGQTQTVQNSRALKSYNGNINTDSAEKSVKATLYDNQQNIFNRFQQY